MRRLVVLPVLLALLAMLVEAPSASAIEEEANRPVATLENALKVMLASEDQGFKDRYLSIYRTVAATHDFDRMARARVGEAWNALGEASQKELKNLLFKRVVGEYVVRLGREDALGLTRGLASDLEGGGGIAALSRDGRVIVSFRVDPVGDAWRITDVRWGGRDTAAAERRESEAVLARADADALAAAWKDKIPVPGDGEGTTAEGRGPEDGGGEAAAVAANSPREVVDDLQERIIGIMKEASALGFEGRYERFQPLIDRTHHLPAIAQATILRPWSKLTQDQRRQFVTKFREFSIARYAARFDGYSGERFETKDVKEQGDLRVVESDLVKSDGDRVRFDWILREIGGRWRILNIIVDGVSDLATKKEEYRAIYERRGFEGLMEEVEAQIRAQRTGN